MNVTSAATARLPILLTELRMPTIKRMLPTLFDLEMAERAQRRLTRYRDESQLPADKRLESFDFSPLPMSHRPTCTLLPRVMPKSRKAKDLVMFGPPGAGQTRLACSLRHELFDRGWRVFFTGTSELVQRLQAARRGLRLPAQRAKIDRFDLLILDNLG